MVQTVLKNRLTNTENKHGHPRVTKRWEGSVRGLGLTHTYTHTTRYKMGNQQEKHRKLDSVSHNDL